MDDCEKTKKQLIDDLNKLRRKKSSEIAEERFRRLYKGIPIPSYIWQWSGDDLVLVEYNDSAEQLTEGKINKLVGVKARELYIDEPEIVEDLKRCINDQTQIMREIPYRLKSTGEAKQFSVKYAFVPPDLVLVHTEDITQRKLAEEELMESRERYRSVFANANDAIFLTSPDGKIFSANPAACSTFGFSEKEFQTLGREAIVDITDPRLERAIRKRSLHGSYKGELTFKKRNGEKLECEVTSTIFELHDGQLRAVIVVRDITARKLAEERLKEKQREILESNAALRILSKQREDDKKDFEERILSNIELLIMPYLDTLKCERQMSNAGMSLLKVIESNLNEITSTFSIRLAHHLGNLSPAEIRIADLVKAGSQDKGIAELLNISIDTVKAHRRKIRKKLAITRKKINLQSYLSNFS